MISVKDLTKNYGTFCALSDVNMSIESGKTIAILGPNGAWKHVRYFPGLQEQECRS